MQNLNSHEIFFLNLYKVLLLEDMVRQYGNAKSFLRDFKTTKSRVENEGFSFFTKTLPALGKAIDTALQTGTLTNMPHFKNMRSYNVPCYLQVLLKRVFNEDGILKEDPCVAAVNDLRQISFLVYKYEGVENYDSFSYQAFKETDISLGFDTPIEVTASCKYSNILDTARTLVSDLFRDGDFKYSVPGHGPGAVASGEKNWEKYNFRTFYTRIHESFPYYHYFFSNAMDLAANTKKYWVLKENSDPGGIAKCVLVPKDSRGPRLISMEPLEFQYVQQGLKDKLYEYIEKHPLTRGHVNFTNQEINRDLALRGSISGNLVTLDMKEASDRISLWLVNELFRDTSFLRELQNSRTEATELGTGEIHLLRKFAPMGSALCFPIEAVVHWALSVASLHVSGGYELERALSAVYVYGDDIIIEGCDHQTLYDDFPIFKLMFNEGKSCTMGSFRESCGMDAYRGWNITPLKIKKGIPSSPYDANSYVAYIEYVNNLWERAYYATSLYISGHLEDIYPLPIPYVKSGADTPGFVNPRPTFRIYSNKSKFERNTCLCLHYDIYKVSQVSGKNITTKLSRCEYLRKLQIQAIGNETVEFHAGVYSVPHRIKLKQGWSHDLV